MPFAAIKTIRRGRSNSHRLNRCCGSLMRSHGAGPTRRNSGATLSRDSSQSTIKFRKTRSPQVPTVRTARGLTSQGSCPSQHQWCHKCLTSTTVSSAGAVCLDCLANECSVPLRRCWWRGMCATSGTATRIRRGPVGQSSPSVIELAVPLHASCWGAGSNDVGRDPGGMQG